MSFRPRIVRVRPALRSVGSREMPRLVGERVCQPLQRRTVAQRPDAVRPAGVVLGRVRRDSDR